VTYLALVLVAVAFAATIPPAVVTYAVPSENRTSVPEVAAPSAALLVPPAPVAPEAASVSYHPVPFYSQFYDISDPTWQKVGCGIASIAMVIGYHTNEPMDVEALLAKGRAAGAFLPQAGWTHAGLIDLARPYGLTGGSHSLAHLRPSTALAELAAVVAEAPVLVSVHYTFEPTNPIPHLVVVTGVDETTVYYSDPAEPTGVGEISIEKFLPAWKQRYIRIVPVS